jgi:uncharacterized protein affecting Mg2+/Co2+ transport
MVLVSSWGFVAVRKLLSLDNQLLTARNYLFSSVDCRSSTEFIVKDFLRAARLWSKIERWLDSPQSKDVGPRIHGTLNPGRHGHEWQRQECEALQVVYAFYGGQVAFDLQQGLEGMFSGLIGGWNAYNVYSCTSLIAPEFHINVGTVVQFATTTILANHLMMCRILVDTLSGDLFLQVAGSDRIKMCSGVDAVLSWMELHADRLDQGLIGVGPMGSDPRDHLAIVLYPRPPRNSPPTVGVQAASRAVTRGVEVVASAVYSPLLAANGMGFIYSFRIRILTPEDGDEYVPPEDRGFETCRLGSRHWQIINAETGEMDRVDGDGVIGMKPVLYEGGYHENSDDRVDGPFIYQSCTGRMKKGRFQGHLTFVAGNDSDSPHPTGRFDVTVAPFLLDSEPEYLY